MATLRTVAVGGTTMSGVRTMMMAVAALMLAACSGTGDAPGGDADPPDGGSTTMPPTTTMAATTTLPVGGVKWDDPSRIVDLGDGFTVAACPGDAPLPCVTRNDAPAGLVEAQRYPISSLPDRDPAADDETNLTALADAFVASFRTQRAEGCGPDYHINPVAVTPVQLDGRPGIVFGFEGRLATGEPSELDLHYATVVDDAVVMVIANADDAGGCPGPDPTGGFDSATLGDFRPHLEAPAARHPASRSGLSRRNLRRGDDRGYDPPVTSHPARRLPCPSTPPNSPLSCSSTPPARSTVSATCGRSGRTSCSSSATSAD